MPSFYKILLILFFAMIATQLHAQQTEVKTTRETQVEANPPQEAPPAVRTAEEQKQQVKKISPSQPPEENKKPEARKPRNARPEIERPGAGRRPAGAGRPKGAQRPGRFR